MLEAAQRGSQESPPAYVHGGVRDYVRGAVGNMVGTAKNIWKGRKKCRQNSHASQDSASQLDISDGQVEADTLSSSDVEPASGTLRQLEHYKRSQDRLRNTTDDVWRTCEGATISPRHYITTSRLIDAHGC